MLPWKLRKRQILPVNQNLSSVYFSLAKFQLVSCNLSLAMIWQMTYTHKLPKLCSATLRVYIDISKCLGYIRTIQDSFCAVTKSYRIVVCYTAVFSVVTQQRHVA